MTDADGFYYFTQVGSGRHTLRISMSRKKGPTLVMLTLEIPATAVFDVREMVLPAAERSIRIYRHRGLEPISLLYQRDGDVAYTVSSGGNRVFEIDRRVGELREIGSLSLRGSGRDHCLLSQDRESWIVSLSSQRSFGHLYYINYITLTALRRGKAEPLKWADRTHLLSFGAPLTSVACDLQGRRALFTHPSPFKGGVHSVDVEKGSLQRLHQLSNLDLSRPFSIAVDRGLLYVADRGRGSVVVVDPERDGPDELVPDLEKPSGLSVSHDLRLLLGADVTDRWVFQQQLPRGELRYLLGSDDGLRLPVATQMLRDGTVLVADQDRGLIFQLDPS